MSQLNRLKQSGLVIALCLLVFITGCEPLEYDKPHSPGNNINIVIMINNPDTFNREDVEIDWIQINSRFIEADTLFLNVSYNGSCRSHSFRMYASEPIWITDGFQCALYLSHDDKGDSCTDLVTETIGFVLSPIHEDVQLRIFQFGADDPMYPLLQYNGGD